MTSPMRVFSYGLRVSKSNPPTVAYQALGNTGVLTKETPAPKAHATTLKTLSPNGGSGAKITS